MIGICCSCIFLSLEARGNPKVPLVVAQIALKIISRDASNGNAVSTSLLASLVEAYPIVCQFGIIKKIIVWIDEKQCLLYAEMPILLYI